LKILIIKSVLRCIYDLFNDHINSTVFISILYKINFSRVWFKSFLISGNPDSPDSYNSSHKSLVILWTPLFNSTPYLNPKEKSFFPEIWHLNDKHWLQKKIRVNEMILLNAQTKYHMLSRTSKSQIIIWIQCNVEENHEIICIEMIHN
jgi:hypothetical protein